MTLRRLSVLLCAWLSLCAALAAATPPALWLDVPFVPQEKDGCGAASIAMVMQYWQRQRGHESQDAADARAIHRALYSRRGHGMYASHLEGYLRSHGFRTFAFRGEWSDLAQHLEKGRPLILALQPSPRAALHYVVLAGLEGEQGLVLVNDPAQRKLLKRERAEFDREWSAAGNWTLLAVPQQDGR